MFQKLLRRNCEKNFNGIDYCNNDASKITDIIQLTVSYKLCGDFG